MQAQGSNPLACPLPEASPGSLSQQGAELASAPTAALLAWSLMQPLRRQLETDKECQSLRLCCRLSFWGASCSRGLCGTSCHWAIPLPAAHFVPGVFLVRSVGHVHKRVTDHLSVVYYVADTFSEEYTGSSLKTVERNVEDDYIANLRNNCWKEKQQKEGLLYRARYFGDTDMYHRAQKMGTPSCSRLSETMKSLENFW
ncbi:dnaJ homolog subfamily C member 18 [Peromyscus leucopus]|uniref:dnaJ homolog subfamily C member 18 n=1 Tax=Peromyscus leucopus TaxID=10041 RepID=UPI0010A0D4A8|nr:dnaJ homolog subfamily C member 18 [Peromyscus leucopus]